MATKKNSKQLKQQSKKLDLANPVTIAANRIKALIDQIPGMSAAYEYEEKTLTVYVSDFDKGIPLKMLLRRKHDVGGGLVLNVKAYDVSGVVPEELTPPTWTITDEGMFENVKILLRGFKYAGFEPEFTEIKMPKSKDVFRFIELAPLAMFYDADTLQNPYGSVAEFPADLFKLAFDCNSFMVSTIAPRKNKQ